MTTVFYDGKNLASDTCMLLPSIPSEFTVGTKIFKSVDGTFAYGWSGSIASSDESRIRETERSFNALCEMLYAQHSSDREEWSVFQDYVRSRSVNKVIDAIVDQLDFILMTRTAAWVTTRINSTRLVAPIFSTASVGTGQHYIDGIFSQVKDVQEAYCRLELIDPLTNSELMIIPQESLKPYVSGVFQ